MRVQRIPWQGRRRRDGTSSFELAVILPVFVMLALGVTDFGRFAYHYIAVTNAARAGGEYATMNPYTPSGASTWQTQVQQTARNELFNQTGCDPNLLTTTTTVTLEQPSGLRRVEIEATYSSFETLVSWPGIPDSTEIRSTVTMRMVR